VPRSAGSKPDIDLLEILQQIALPKQLTDAEITHKLEEESVITGTLGYIAGRRVGKA
jgi:hypothetical protein